ncbi:VOC family protein [Streptomyces sp. NPDC005355]|uniref:VOC family protein n=1 Tax=Streptomyces sp. NPDC005355 TaxID=3157038 RepID=UPI00339F1875
MSTTVYGLSVDAADAADAEKLAHFRAGILGPEVASGASPEFATLDPDRATPRLSFHQVPEPKSVKNRLHLDLISPSCPRPTYRCTPLGTGRCRASLRGDAHSSVYMSGIRHSVGSPPIASGHRTDSRQRLHGPLTRK